MSTSIRSIPIVLASSTLTGGGAEKQLYLFLRGLDRRRYRPEVVTYVWGQWAEKIQALDIPVRCFDYRRGRLAAIRGTYFYLKAQRPLILHAWGVTAGLMARPAARLARIPAIIMSERNTPLQNWSARHWWLELVLRRFTTCYLTNSRHAAEALVNRNLLSRDRIAVVHNGIDLSDYPLAEGSGNGLLIGYTGTFKAQKESSLPGGRSRPGGAGVAPGPIPVPGGRPFKAGDRGRGAESRSERPSDLAGLGR